MKNCTGINCIMQYDKVDPATCKCVLYCPQATPPITNADRIRSMTDEELTELFIQIQNDISNYYDKGHSISPEFPTYVESWLDWLKEAN